jgi:hypothetical protein
MGRDRAETNNHPRRERKQMADTPKSEGRAGGISRKLLIPVAISAVGTLLGYVLSKKDRLPEAASKLRETVSDLPVPETPGRTGELGNELRGKLDKVLGKEQDADSDFDSGIPTKQDLSKFEDRRRERQKRRNQRRQRSRS